MILAVVDDLIFLSKIQQTASLTNIQVAAIGPQELAARLSRDVVAAVICDLNHRSGQALDVIRGLKQSEPGRRVPILGFLSHIQEDLARKAREAGCDVVMARSAFSRELPQILLKYAAGDTTPAAPPRLDHAD